MNVSHGGEAKRKLNLRFAVYECKRKAGVYKFLMPGRSGGLILYGGA